MNTRFKSIRTLFVHVIIWLNSGVPWQSHSKLAKQLAELQSNISLVTLSRFLEIPPVEDIKLVNVSVGEF